MIVALDAQLTLGTATGIGEYVRGLASGLRALGVDVRELCEPRLDPWRFDRRVLWDQLVLPRRVAASGADLLHCASGTMPIRRTLPSVVTVHDVAWLRVQSHARPYARYYFGSFSLQRYEQAAAIAVDSWFSKRELLALSAVPPERVHVVYPGVARDFCELVRTPGTQPVGMIPGTVERRKNLEVLIRALTRLPALRLVCVGPTTPYRDRCVALARRLGVENRIEFRGYVGRAELLMLYATCSFVAVPSRYEGFGYAAAQALCAGAPVVVSDRSSLPEVVGADAPVVAADDDEAWAAAMEAILRNAGPAHERAARARGRAIERFAWAASARAMMEVYAAAVGTAPEPR